jgi:surfactin synthase thioesterase subunit
MPVQLAYHVVNPFKLNVIPGYHFLVRFNSSSCLTSLVNAQFSVKHNCVELL